jgi:hypothetical protein
MSLTKPLFRITLALFTVLTAASAQSRPTPGQPEPIPPMLRGQPFTPEPTTPPAQTFHDRRYGVTFTVPAAWNLNRKDAEVSTFRFDARSASRSTQLRAVATISFNPHPYSTFSGALFYFSVTPRTSPEQCSAQATLQPKPQPGSQAPLPPPRSITTTPIAGIPFTHGYDEHGTICTESRDEIYTTSRNHGCYRFDVVINTFCGGDVSGVQDITPRELDAVRHRMQTILDSVKFDTK